MKCKQCDCEFKPKMYNQRYCSVECRNKFWNTDFYGKNREKILIHKKTEEYKKYQRKIRKQNHVKSRRNAIKRHKNANDPIYKLRSNIARWLRLKFYGVFKESQLENVLGYTIKTLWEHLKTTIPEGFSEQDYLNGILQLDHIIPQAAYYSFEPGDIEFGKCWNLRNLRLLRADKNKTKNNRIYWNLIIELEDIFPISISDVVLKIKNGDLSLEKLDTSCSHQ